MIRELKDVIYVPQLKKNLISIGALKAQGLKRDSWRWHSQDTQRLDSCSEGY